MCISWFLCVLSNPGTYCSFAHREVSGRLDQRQTEQVSGECGDVSATWRMAQTMLHDKQKTIFDNAECAKHSASSSLTR